jgi:hypothetical protein
MSLKACRPPNRFDSLRASSSVTLPPAPRRRLRYLRLTELTCSNPDPLTW